MATSKNGLIFSVPCFALAPMGRSDTTMTLQLIVLIAPRAAIRLIPTMKFLVLAFSKSLNVCAHLLHPRRRGVG